MDKWDKDMINNFKKQGGNAKVNSLYEAHLHDMEPGNKAREDSSRQDRADFIREKYEAKRWHHNSPKPEINDAKQSLYPSVAPLSTKHKPLSTKQHKRESSPSGSRSSRRSHPDKNNAHSLIDSLSSKKSSKKPKKSSKKTKKSKRLSHIDTKAGGHSSLLSAGRSDDISMLDSSFHPDDEMLKLHTPEKSPRDTDAIEGLGLDDMVHGMHDSDRLPTHTGPPITVRSGKISKSSRRAPKPKGNTPPHPQGPPPPAPTAPPPAATVAAATVAKHAKHAKHKSGGSTGSGPGSHSGSGVGTGGMSVVELKKIAAQMTYEQKQQVQKLVKTQNMTPTQAVHAVLRHSAATGLASRQRAVSMDRHFADFDNAFDSPKMISNKHDSTKSKPNSSATNPPIPQAGPKSAASKDAKLTEQTRRMVVAFSPGPMGLMTAGQKITRVTKGGQADQKGVKEGWLLVEVAGTPVRNNKEVIHQLKQQLGKGGPFNLTFNVPTKKPTTQNNNQNQRPTPIAATAVKISMDDDDDDDDAGQDAKQDQHSHSQSSSEDSSSSSSSSDSDSDSEEEEDDHQLEYKAHRPNIPYAKHSSIDTDPDAMNDNDDDVDAQFVVPVAVSVTMPAPKAGAGGMQRKSGGMQRKSINLPVVKSRRRSSGQRSSARSSLSINSHQQPPQKGLMQHAHQGAGPAAGPGHAGPGAGAGAGPGAGAGAGAGAGLAASRGNMRVRSSSTSSYEWKKKLETVTTQTVEAVMLLRKDSLAMDKRLTKLEQPPQTQPASLAGLSVAAVGAGAGAAAASAQAASAQARQAGAGVIPPNKIEAALVQLKQHNHRLQAQMAQIQTQMTQLQNENKQLKDFVKKMALSFKTHLKSTPQSRQQPKLHSSPAPPGGAPIGPGEDLMAAAVAAQAAAAPAAAGGGGSNPFLLSEQKSHPPNLASPPNRSAVAFSGLDNLFPTYPAHATGGGGSLASKGNVFDQLERKATAVRNEQGRTDAFM
eukprot:CAMPEP_0197522056 /NCGR_PEP_ID=MMETSP1318-20131121/7250_1 /TAXON_ID=552666 /ORGANISM="Partenskyella glossopodia, Strain RCC365" /LENGTH=985 /DNA_ID=CAMNT_0043074277 /DNA_START=339 /DNA_END=3296 /DNA_ORIENTATION=-